MSELRQKLDVTELMTRIEAGGPKMALTLATLDVEILSGRFRTVPEGNLCRSVRFSSLRWRRHGPECWICGTPK